MDAWGMRRSKMPAEKRVISSAASIGSILASTPIAGPWLEPVALPLPRIGRQRHAPAAGRIDQTPIDRVSRCVECAERSHEDGPLVFLASQRGKGRALLA